MSSTSQSRSGQAIPDVVLLGIFCYVACVGFGAQVWFFRQAAAQIGLWMPVVVLTFCGLVAIATFGALLTPFVRRVGRSLRLDARQAGSCLVAGCTHDCRVSDGV